MLRRRPPCATGQNARAASRTRATRSGRRPSPPSSAGPPSRAPAELRADGPHQPGERIAVIRVDEPHRTRTLVGDGGRAQRRCGRGGLLDEQTIVVDAAEQRALRVEEVLPHHLPRGQALDTREKVEDIIEIALRRRHDSLLSSNPLAPLDDRAVARVRQILHSEPEDGVFHHPLTSIPDSTSARRRSMRGVSGSSVGSPTRRAASSGNPCSSSYSAR